MGANNPNLDVVAALMDKNPTSRAESIDQVIAGVDSGPANWGQILQVALTRRGIDAQYSGNTSGEVYVRGVFVPKKFPSFSNSGKPETRYGVWQGKYELFDAQSKGFDVNDAAEKLSEPKVVNLIASNCSKLEIVNSKDNEPRLSRRDGEWLYLDWRDLKDTAPERMYEMIWRVMHPWRAKARDTLSSLRGYTQRSYSQ